MILRELTLFAYIDEHELVSPILPRFDLVNVRFANSALGVIYYF
jgi:hypothetical protein